MPKSETRLSKVERAAVLNYQVRLCHSLREKGLSIRQIASQLNMDKMKVWRRLQRERVPKYYCGFPMMREIFLARVEKALADRKAEVNHG